MGIAPDDQVGRASPLDPAKTLTRPLRPYPQQAQYKGIGDSNGAANFICTTPAK